MVLEFGMAVWEEARSFGILAAFEIPTPKSIGDLDLHGWS